MMFLYSHLPTASLWPGQSDLLIILVSLEQTPLLLMALALSLKTLNSLRKAT
jgi:hypothetical protein